VSSSFWPPVVTVAKRPSWRAAAGEGERVGAPLVWVLGVGERCGVERSGRGGFYRRAGSVGGGSGQWEGECTVAGANGGVLADVWAGQGDDVRVLASAEGHRRGKEGWVERERLPGCVRSCFRV
jgi:hypothetical protein